MGVGVGHRSMGMGMATPSAESPLSLHHFVEKLPVGGYLPTGTPFREGSDPAPTAAAAASSAAAAAAGGGSRASLYWELQRTWERLQARGLGTVPAIETYVLQQQQQQQQQQPPDTDTNKEKEADGGEDRDRDRDREATAAPKQASTMAAPFWLATDTAHLYDILVRVFPQGH